MSSSEPSKWTTALGASADVNVIPATTPAGTGLASMASIFPAITQVPIDSGGIAPERADFNALFKMLGDQSYFLQQGGVYSYSASYPYSVGDVVLYGGILYRCIQAHAAGAAAPGNASYWSAIASAGDIPTKTSQLQNDSGFITASSLPTVNNGTLTIQQDGTTVGTFTANQSGNTTVNLTSGGGGGGTLSGTILGGFVGSASQTPGIYTGTVGTEYDVSVLYQALGGHNGSGGVFSTYPRGTKFECIVASYAKKESQDAGNDNYTNITNGAFKLKSLGGA